MDSKIGNSTQDLVQPLFVFQIRKLTLGKIICGT
ncbi:hypothetical protein PRBEI_2001107200 [Prionailurus iriomotensis]